MHVLNYQGKIKDTIRSYTVKCDNEMYGMFCSQLIIDCMWLYIDHIKFFKFAVNQSYVVDYWE